MRLERVIALTIAVVSCAGCGQAPKDVPSTTHGLDGVAVNLEARGSKVDSSNELVWDGLARNDEKKPLIGLTLRLTLKRTDDTAIETLEVSPVDSRARITVLEPGFSVPIHIKEKLKETPASIEAYVSESELFKDEADTPLTLETKPLAGADAAVLETQSLGHFSVGAFSGGKGLTPFHMTLGIRNKSGASIRHADLQIVFTDDKKKEIDRIPVTRDFVPPLRPGDAVLEPVIGDARPYAGFFVEVRALTKAE